MTTSANDIAKAINQFHTEMERLHLSVKIRLLSANTNDYMSVKASVNVLNAYVYLGHEGDPSILGVPFVEDVPSKVQKATTRAETSLSPEQMKALENAEVPKEHEHLNAELWPEMTDAELLLNCQSLAMEFADDNMRKECELAAFELVKKYRGM